MQQIETTEFLALFEQFLGDEVIVPLNLVVEMIPVLDCDLYLLV